MKSVLAVASLRNLCINENRVSGFRVRVSVRDLGIWVWALGFRAPRTLNFEHFFCFFLSHRGFSGAGCGEKGIALYVEP